MDVKIEKFEGPLSLLLKLIEQEEMDITQISLAKIADQYVNYIKTAENISPDDMADFLVVAARLLLIKSKALLPYLYPEEEEEIEELEKQLRMYKEFIEASKLIAKMAGKKKFMFAREFNRKVILSNANVFSPPKKLVSDDLSVVMRDIIARVRPPEKLEEQTLDHKINIEDKIYSIQQMLLKRIKFSFSKLMKGAKSKTEVIVSFLAMLELEKQRSIIVRQDGLFSEIMINKYEEMVREAGAASEEMDSSEKESEKKEEPEPKTLEVADEEKEAGEGRSPVDFSDPDALAKEEEEDKKDNNIHNYNIE